MLPSIVLGTRTTETVVQGERWSSTCDPLMEMKVLPDDCRAALSKIRDVRKEFITQRIPSKHCSGNLTTHLPQVATHGSCEIVFDSARRTASVSVPTSWRADLEELNKLNSNCVASDSTGCGGYRSNVSRLGLIVLKFNPLMFNAWQEV